MKKIDLLIIGAGPAGLSTALHLVQIDPTWATRLLIIEKAEHPRHKLCGGGITRFGMRALSGLNITPNIPRVQVNDVRFAYKDKTFRVRGAGEIIVYHRKELDAHLAQQAKAAGIIIHENEAVRDIQWGAASITVTTSRDVYHAQTVVGADGSRGVTRTLLKRDATPATVARLLESIHPAAADYPAFTESYALFDFTPAADAHLQGYVWDFPAKVAGQPHHNRGTYDTRLARKRPRARLPALLRGTAQTLGADPASIKIEGHPIHLFRPSNPFATNRLLLVGDAIGAEPLFGEGIAPALWYGKFAARSIETAFRQQNFSYRDYRRRVLFSYFGAYMLARWAAAWWVYRLCQFNWFMQTTWKIGKILAWLLGKSKPYEKK